MRSIKARQGEGKKVMIWGFIGLGMGQPERQVRGWGGEWRAMWIWGLRGMNSKNYSHVAGHLWKSEKL